MPERSQASALHLNRVPHRPRADRLNDSNQQVKTHSKKPLL